MMAVQAQFYQDNFGFGSGGPMENGYGFNEFCFNHNQFGNETPFFDINGASYPPNVAVQMEKQRVDVDHFIDSQNEILRLVLQEQRKQHTSLILKKHEARTSMLLKQKEAEIARAMNRTMELQEIVKRMEIESESWQRVVTEKEAVVESLRNAIEQMRENAWLANEAESCCDNSEIGERRKTMVVVCESCHNRESTIVFLPCRHLCSCKDCYAFMDSCPVCGMAKKAGIEALI